jgi:hypothetical protein
LSTEGLAQELEGLGEGIKSSYYLNWGNSSRKAGSGFNVAEVPFGIRFRRKGRISAAGCIGDTGVVRHGTAAGVEYVLAGMVCLARANTGAVCLGGSLNGVRGEAYRIAGMFVVAFVMTIEVT